MTSSRDAAHFARLYQANPDPWGFGADPYEQAKYAHSLRVLGDRRFVSALEVGCSIGVLTRMLAPRCAALLGVDIVDQPLVSATKRCAGLPHVSFRRMRVPDEWPGQRFDLIVFSEILYFLSAADIDRCAALAVACLLPDAMVLLVNWLGQSDDPTPGNQAAERFISATEGTLMLSHQERLPGYRLDLLSVA